MLRLIQIGNSLPLSYPTDPTATFEPGQIAQLKVIGNEIVSGISDGTAPLGIIDDMNASAFTSPVKDEVVIIPAVSVSDGYRQVVATDTKEELQFANVVRSSFVADIEGLTLNDVNGVVTVAAGTALNYDNDGDGELDSVRAIVSYVYRIPNIPGDNTTIGSGRMTIWIDRGIYETDQYDTTQRYAVNATLFVNEEGKFTTKQTTANSVGVAMVTGPPSGIVNTLELLWF